MLLKNHTSVITGCNKGIGKSILENFSANGSDIFACVRKIDEEFKNDLNAINSFSHSCEINSSFLSFID